MLGTPHSVRFNNIFKDTSPNPTLLEIIESFILLPKTGGERISTLCSETAADIKTLAATVLGLVEQSPNLPYVGRHLFSGDDDNHQVERALAGSKNFGCKVPGIVKTRLDKINKTLNEIEEAFKLPTQRFNFTSSATAANPKTPLYALAVSRHAPRHHASSDTMLREFRPVLHKKPPPPPPTVLRSSNTITLVQSEKDGSKLGLYNYPSLIALINSKLTEANIKEKASDAKPLQICLVHRHPSNNVVIYTTTPQQAEAIRK